MRCAGSAWVVTRFPSGVTVEAHPQHGPEDEARAEALGYPNVDAMTLVHDPLHQIVSHLLRGEPSAVVTGAADSELADAEEHVVLAVQRYLNVLGRLL